MEETGLREPLLPAVYPDAGHQFWNQLHLQGSQEQTGSGKGFQLVPVLAWTLAVPGLTPPGSGTAEELVLFFRVIFCLCW